eukprot:scaffold3450_cov114-Cylindrotheca_fusiformis.AAC.16
MADTKPRITISPQAFLTISLHSAFYSNAVGHGVLVGTKSDSEVMVEHAFPICHEVPTKPLLDTAMALVKSEITGEGDTAIIGWFTSPEILSDTKADAVSMRICANISTDSADPVLLVLQSEKLGELASSSKGTTSSECFKAFGRDFGKQWLEPLPLIVLQETITTEVTREAIRKGVVMYDLTDHWLHGSSSLWQHSVNTSSGPLRDFIPKLNVS